MRFVRRMCALLTVDVVAMLMMLCSAWRNSVRMFGLGEASSSSP